MLTRVKKWCWTLHFYSMHKSLDIRNSIARGLLVEQKLVLSCSFSCGQFHSNHKYEFSHTAVLIKSDLEVQQTTPLESAL